MRQSDRKIKNQSASRTEQTEVDPVDKHVSAGAAINTEAKEPSIIVRDMDKEFQIYSTPGRKLLEILGGGRWKLHDRKVALSGINFSIGEGSCLGLVGQNGSGKSTLLRILAKIMAPTKGEVITNGKTCSMLDLTSGFNLEFPGVENIFNKCALLGLSRAETEERLEDIIRFSGLGHRVHHPIKTYSTGMLLRLGFSTIIHSDFDILLVDEVLFVGDEVFSRQCQAILTRLIQAKGKTVVVSSHSLGQLTNFCNYLLYLDDGQQVMIAPTDEVIQEYLMTCDMRYGRVETPICVDRSGLCATETLGKIRLDKVEVFDQNGNSIEEIYCKDPLKIRIHYNAEEPVTEPCFRVQFFSNQGVFIHGTNTYRQELKLGQLHGKGVIELEYPAFHLLEGDYYLNVGIWPDEYASFAAKTPYDVLEFVQVLSVHSRRPDGGGLVHVNNRWRA